jgi:hypothetical protein
VKLSGAVQPLPKEHTEFVHGVSPSFLEVSSHPDTLVFLSVLYHAAGFDSILRHGRLE